MLLRFLRPHAAGLADRMSVPSVRRHAIAKAPRRPAKVIRMPIPEVVRLQRRKRLRGLILTALILGAIAFWDQFGRSNAEAKGLLTTLRPNPVELLLLERVNAARERVGSPPLAWSSGLMRAAYFHSADMAAAHYVAYDGLAGDTPVDRVTLQGLDYQELGENLFAVSDDSLGRLADIVIAHWLANREERANLLSVDFRATGIGVARAADGSFYITQDLVR
jgi:hypothetical protein